MTYLVFLFAEIFHELQKYSIKRRKSVSTFYLALTLIISNDDCDCYLRRLECAFMSQNFSFMYLHRQCGKWQKDERDDESIFITIL